MSRLFGPMRQVGIVVRDIETAMRHWVEVCGVGPWFYTEQLPMDEFRYVRPGHPSKRVCSEDHHLPLASTAQTQNHRESSYLQAAPSPGRGSRTSDRSRTCSGYPLAF